MRQSGTHENAVELEKSEPSELGGLPEGPFTLTTTGDLNDILTSLGIGDNPDQLQLYPQEEMEVPQPPQPEMELIVQNRMIRLRYDSELNNRHKGKEELIRVVIKNHTGRVYIRIQTVDINHHKSHPYCLIGEHCLDEVYFKEFQVDPANNLCICKATLRIPKKGEYENVLQTKYKAYKDKTKFPIQLRDMQAGDFWTCNKGMKECTDFKLHVEVFYQIEENSFGYLQDVSDTLCNAKDGKKFDIHRLCPFSVPVTGLTNMAHSLVIILTGDSLIPKKVKIIFQDEEGWSVTISDKDTNIIKNVIECIVPAYKEQFIDGPKKITVKVEDVQRKMSTDPKDMQYHISMADMDVTERKRKKPTPPFRVPENVQHIQRQKLKGKLRQKCQGTESNPVSTQPISSTAFSLTTRGISGNLSTSSATSSSTAQPVFQQPLTTGASNITDDIEVLLSSWMDTQNNSGANLLAPSGTSMPTGTVKREMEDFVKEYEKVKQEQEQQQCLQQIQPQQQQQQRRQQQQTRQHLMQQQQTQQQQWFPQQQMQQHSLLIGNGDGGVFNNIFQPPTTTQNHGQFLLVNPTTLQPQSQSQNSGIMSLESDLDLLDDVEIDAAPKLLKEKVVKIVKVEEKETSDPNIKKKSENAEEKHELPNVKTEEGSEKDIKNTKMADTVEKKETSCPNNTKNEDTEEKNESPSVGTGEGSEMNIKITKMANNIEPEPSVTSCKLNSGKEMDSENENIRCHCDNLKVKNKNMVKLSKDETKTKVENGSKVQMSQDVTKKENEDSLNCTELKDALPSDDLESDCG